MIGLGDYRYTGAGAPNPGQATLTDTSELQNQAKAEG
jgi:hypothetical protein